MARFPLSCFLGYWVHDWQPFLVRFSEHFGIRYYGLAYLLGFVAAAWIFRRYYRSGRTPLDPEATMDLMLYLVAGVFIGGRVGYFVLYQWQALIESPWILFRVWEGGMASHGGFVGVIIAMALYSRRRKAPFLHVADLVTSATPLGLMFGRIANFINGELWGKPTTVPWAVIFVNTGGGPEPRHPSQLYEAGLEGALLFGYMQWRFWRSDVIRTQPGRLSGEFLLGYAIVRAIGELFREPDAGISLIVGLSRGTFYSLFLAAAGTVMIVICRRTESASGSAKARE